MTDPIANFTGKNGFLSNFHVSHITVGQLTYPTVEHYFQACKTEDPRSHNKIRSAGTPSVAKRLGRSVQLRSDWDDVRLDVMRTGLAAKFCAGSELANRLLSTGDAELVEGNTWNDTYWGVCRGTGENWLGQLLMERRTQLKENK